MGHIWMPGMKRSVEDLLEKCVEDSKKPDGGAPLRGIDRGDQKAYLGWCAYLFTGLLKMFVDQANKIVQARRAENRGIEAPSVAGATGGVSASSANDAANTNGAGRGGRRWRNRQAGAGRGAPSKAGTRCHGCNEIGHWVNECPQKGIHFCGPCHVKPVNVGKMGIGTTNPCAECLVLDGTAYQQDQGAQMQATVIEEGDFGV